MSAGAALPAGLVVRTPTYVEDGVAELEDVLELVTACDVAVVGEPDTGRDDLRGMLAGESNDRERTVLVEDASGALRGFVWIERDPTAGDSWCDVYVRPGTPPAAADALYDHGFALGLAAATAHRDREGATSWTLRTGAFAQDERLRAAIARAGLAQVRRFWRMRIDTDSPAVPATMPELPDGVTLVVARSEDELRRAHAVQQAAFADHWDFVPRSWEEWSRHFAERGLSEDGSWLLQVDGEDAAVLMLDETRADLGGGYVPILGVRREFRGRGLAALLLRRAFVRSREEGRSFVALSVDSTSPTGAQRLYERVGMTAARVIDAFARELD
ncbi:MAG: GNAT family N-acetyltransferase [Frankiales bacterium]|nr:GNAT family N-acetyltransferase [Frankiales bacterium]